jgi:di/tricarboxylate transporter
METTFLLTLMVIAMVLFSLETVSVDLVALGMIVALLLSGILTPSEALSGFSNEAIIVLAGLFVLTAALRVTGAIDPLGRWATRVASHRPWRAVPLLLAVTILVSGFMNNTTCTALFLPVGLALARSTSTAGSRVLMPLAFASILGGTITVMGTSTNVIVRGLMPQYGLSPLGMFELAPVALPIALLGWLYLLIARRLLPERSPEGVADRYPLREYLTEVVVLERSPLIGRTLAQADLGRVLELNLLAIIRDGEPVVPQPHDVLNAGDVLVVEGSVEALESVSRIRGLRIRPTQQWAEGALEASSIHLVEALILPRSELEGRTLKEAGFRQRYRANVIAVNRHSEVLVEKLKKIRLRIGDVLLIEGGPSAAERLATQKGLLVLDARPASKRSRRVALFALAVFAAVIVLAALSPIGLAGAILAGCLVLLLSRCLTPAEAYAAVDWRMLVLIAGMMAYGAAMEKTGTSALLAGWVLDLIGSLGVRGVLAGFYLLTLALTQPMSNQAAALVVFPVAMDAAVGLGLDPRAMAVTIALAASSSFLTPLEPSSLLVYGPGGYRFRDYPRLGAGLTLLAFLITLLLVPLLWPS